MRVTLDASVLFPTVTRRMLLATAGAGAFTPIWSPRLIEEWRRAVARRYPESSQAVGVEIALMQANWPGAERKTPENLEPYWLPDLDDRHVLGLAVVTSCDAIVTINAKDFPKAILAEYKIERFDPDTFLTAMLSTAKHGIMAEAAKIAQDFPEKSMRAIFKKARLPKLAKALETELNRPT